MKSKKILIYHTDVDKETATPDDLDVFEEVEFTSKYLQKLGYSVESLPFKLRISKNNAEDIPRILQEISQISPSFIFNLVEVVDGKEFYNFMAPLIFEKAEIPYTGCTRTAFYRTRSKLDAKYILISNGIPTPFYLSYNNINHPKIASKIKDKKFLIKSSVDHASKGLESKLFQGIEEIQSAFGSKGRTFFAEEYIEGREFNVSIIGNLKDGKVLPVAEMTFENWPNDKLKIVGYEAKWNDKTPEYNATKRTFSFSKTDAKLIRNIQKICKKCWDLFQLRGYARVDFRVSNEGVPYVLEINTNPCISPDAGFVAAANYANINNLEIFRRIIEYSK